MDSKKNVTNDTLVIYIRDLALEEAEGRFAMHRERKEGICIILGENPCISMNGRLIVREITSYKAVYRCSSGVSYSSYESGRCISEARNDWGVLLIPKPTVPEAYVFNSERLLLYPEPSTSSNGEFFDLFYIFEGQQCFVNIHYVDGRQHVFSRTISDYSNVVYGQVMSNMVLLGQDISFLNSTKQKQMAAIKREGCLC